MTSYGTEVETTTLDKLGSTIDVIRTYQDSIVRSTFKRLCIRVKVSSQQDETTEYLLFSDMIANKRLDGTLVVRELPDSELPIRPRFMIEYPKTDIDGTYFIIRSHTELVI